jgi:HEAT repeat protein
VFACDSGPAPGEEATYYGQKLNEGDLKKRESALNHLSKLKDKKSLPFLYDALKGEADDLKPRVVQLVALLGDESSVGPLVDAINYKVGAGRNTKEKKIARANERIAKALGEVADPGNKAAITALTQLAGSNHLETQLAAVVSLGNLKAEDAVEDLVDIADGHQNNFMVKNAIKALGKIGSADAIPVLIKNLFFERKGVSFYAESSYSLFQIGDAAIPALVTTWKGENEELRSLHLKGDVMKAKAFVVLTDLDAKEVIPLALESVDLEVRGPFSAKARLQAHEAIGKLRVNKGAKLLDKFVADIDPGKSEGAVQALVRLGDRGAIAKMLPLATHEGFIKKLPDCAKAEGKGKKACDNSELQVRKMRLDAISQLTTGAELGEWEKWLAAEKNEKLKKILTERKSMLEAAKECGAKSDCWIKKLESDDPRVREKAAWELAWAQPKEALDPLLKALGDSDNYARFAVIQAVWWMNPREGGVKRIDEIIKSEKGKTKFIRINEDLKRLRVKLARAESK